MNLNLKDFNLEPKSAAKPIRDTTLVWTTILALLFICSRYHQIHTWFLSILFIGTLQYHLNILAHDGLHFSLFPNKKTNDRFTRWFLLGPQGVPLSLIRQNHLHHHKYLGEPSDKDQQYYQWEHRAQKSKFLLWLSSSFLGGMAVAIFLKLLQPQSLSKKGEKLSSPSLLTGEDVLSVIGTQAIIFAFIFLLTKQWWAYFVLWVIPLFTVMTGLNSLRSCLEHAEIEHPEKNQRLFSFISNRIERFFLSPFNMNYHAEHHWFMTVPYYQLPQLRAEILERNEFEPAIMCRRTIDTNLASSSR